MKPRARMLLVTVMSLLCVGLVSAPAALAAVSVQVEPTARLGGDTVRATVVVTCDPGMEVLEAHLRVSQDEQTISGESGIARIRCDGRAHRYGVRVTALDGTFHEGEAFASAFVLVIDPTGTMTEQGQDARNITIT